MSPDELQECLDSIRAKGQEFDMNVKSTIILNMKNIVTMNSCRIQNVGQGMHTL